MHGKQINISKVYRNTGAVSSDLHTRPPQFDVNDFLLIRRDLVEWYFWAESVTEAGAVLPSYGKINYLQYRYTPVSVNVGGEFGSVESFEYGRSSLGAVTNTNNGIPLSYIDTGRP